jgi:hypothetical protein
MTTNQMNYGAARFVSFFLLGESRVVTVNVNAINSFWPVSAPTGGVAGNQTQGNAIGGTGTYIALFNGMTYLVRDEYESVLSRVYDSDIEAKKAVDYWKSSVDQFRKAS